MKSELREQLQAWVDGELSPAEAREIEAWVESQPEARSLGNNLLALSRVLRENEPARAVPETRDFYWSKIRRGIEQGERANAAPSQPASTSFPAARWLGWLLPVGAAAMAVAFLFHPADLGAPGNPTSVDVTMTQHEIDTPSTEITTLTFYSAQDTTTVVWLGHIDSL